MPRVDQQSAIARIGADAARRDAVVMESVGLGRAEGTSHEGRLVVVGSPIGNRDDFSKRAQRALSEVDAILCEDTRVTSKLLSAYAIHRRLERADEHVLASPQRLERFVERIKKGARLAFLSDAGMPGVSDPGSALVDCVRDANQTVEVIPGPCAVSTAIAASGLFCPRFFFHGFLARKGRERARQLELLAAIPAASVVYESPRRSIATLRDLAEYVPRRRVAFCRELTKLHEEVLRGCAGELVEVLMARETKGRSLKGECVVVVEAPSRDEVRDRVQPVICDEVALSCEPGDASVFSDEDLKAYARSLLDKGLAPTAAAKALAKERGLSRAKAYGLVVKAVQDHDFCEKTS